MERFTARKASSGGATKQAAAPAAQQPANETFSEMANATAARSGVVGKLLVVSLIVVSIAITAFVGYAIVRGVGGGDLIKEDQYQAVFLADGQIYFGKLDSIGEEYAVLQDIYYLQVQQEVQPDTTAQPQTQISLAKLGNELHGPEDEMFINVDQILFWENLKDDGQVVTAINNFVSGNQPADATQQQQQQQPAEAPADDSSDAGADAADDTSGDGN